MESICEARSAGTKPAPSDEGAADEGGATHQRIISRHLEQQ